MPRIRPLMLQVATGDVIGLGYSDAEVLERVALELAACLPRKVA